MNKGNPVSVRLSKEAELMIEALLAKYPGLYTNRAHLIECAVRRLKYLHTNNKIRLWYEDD